PDVRGLDVAVDDAALVRVREPLQNFDHDVELALERERLAQRDQGAQVPPIHQLHRDEQLVVRLAQVVDRDDVRVLQRTGRPRRGSTRSAILRNPSLLIRLPLTPPQENGGTYLGARTPSKTLAPVPITVPVPSSVPIAVLAWSPIRLPRNCRPVSSRVPAISRRTRPYVFFRFDVIVPALRFAQRPITQWPTKPSCALLAYPRKTQLDSSPRAFVRGPIADARTGPPRTWAFAPTHKGPSSRAPA